jgi:predicted PurR-regulated permease PerM
MWWRKKTKKVDAEAQRQAELDRATVAAAGSFPRGPVILAALGGAALASFGLAEIRSIVAPVFLALVLTICVHPIRVTMERRGIARGIATGTVIAVVFLLLAGLITMLTIAVAQFVNLLPQFEPQLKQLGETIGGWLTSVGFGRTQVHAIVSSFSPSKIVGILGSIFGSAAGLTFSFVVVITSLILMAADASFLGPLFTQLRGTHGTIVVALQSYAATVRKYMVVTAALGLAQGVLSGVALWLLGVPGAFLWGLLMFICSFIPNIGYFIAIVPPIVFGLLVGGLPTLIWVIVLYAVINAVVQTIIQPRVVGNAVALSQTITFLSVLFWSIIIGPIGAILAIPLTLLVRTVLVDTDPAARWWRPVLGDFSQTKVIMKTEHAHRK